MFRLCLLNLLIFSLRNLDHCHANFVYCVVYKVVLAADKLHRNSHGGMGLPPHSQVADLLPGFPSWVPREHRGEVVAAVFATFKSFLNPKKVLQSSSHKTWAVEDKIRQGQYSDPDLAKKNIEQDDHDKVLKSKWLSFPCYCILNFMKHKWHLELL